MARPTDYSEEILAKAEEYLNSCEDKEIEEEKKEGWITYRTKAKLPTIEGLALYLRINRDTVYEWCKVHQEFADIISDLRAEQADRLINSGLSGDYNPTIAKVLLTKHGYREGLEHTGDEGGAIKHDITNQLDKIYGQPSEVPSDSETGGKS
jgi:hypothetical protein